MTQQIAAEIVLARANPTDAHFGLLARKGERVRKQDIVVAKNYLTEDEIDTLNRLVVIFLETAELQGFVAVGAGLVHILLLLQSFIFNIYHTAMLSICWERQLAADPKDGE